MNFYIEIQLLSSSEIPIYFLWEKVYQQIHLALVEVKDSDGNTKVGVSFPEYNAAQHQLGNKLRLFALSREELDGLRIDKWLSRVADYVDVSSIGNVPDNIEKFAIFKRVQVKSSNERLARRKAKRSGMSYEDALSSLNQYAEKVSTLPYINIKSLSSDKRYRLFISLQEVKGDNLSACFSTYGLSSQFSVPMF